MCCPPVVGPPLLVSGCSMSCTVVDIVVGSADNQRTTSAKIVVPAVDRFAT